MFCSYQLSVSSSSSSSSLSEINDDTPLQSLHFNDDPELPVYSHVSAGYSLPKIIDILMNGSIDEARVCKIQPLGVNCNATFIIDFDSVDIADLKADDVGSWKGIGTRRSYFKMDEYNIPEFVKGMSS